MFGVLELELAAAPATVLESEGMGRERRMRGSTLATSGIGNCNAQVLINPNYT